MILNHIVLPSIEDVISEMEEAFDDINKHVIFKKNINRPLNIFLQMKSLWYMITQKQYVNLSRALRKK